MIPVGGIRVKVVGHRPLHRRALGRAAGRGVHRPIPPYFHAFAGSHAVFYRVADDGDLLIVRVLHAAMLPELHLDDAKEG